jgi:hypothetical protein
LEEVENVGATFSLIDPYNDKTVNRKEREKRCNGRSWMSLNKRRKTGFIENTKSKRSNTYWVKDCA